MKDNDKKFNFGENWDNYSKNIISPEKIRSAKEDFFRLCQNQEIKNRTFIDIGFGQGLSLLIATELGAKTVGNDINPICKQVLLNNKQLFTNLTNIQTIPVVIGSILEDKTIESIKQNYPKYDIVHSWGVLHHTGKMWNAIDRCCNLVGDNGKLIIAIYNKHWSSSIWNLIKKTYNFSPTFIKKFMIGIFYYIILVAKFFVTFKNPMKKERGMDFYYDVIDWVGGYPYEYATKEEIQNYIEKLGFRLIYFKSAEVPTGCHEYVFLKNSNR